MGRAAVFAMSLAGQGQATHADKPTRTDGRASGLTDHTVWRLALLHDDQRWMREVKHALWVVGEWGECVYAPGCAWLHPAQDRPGEPQGAAGGHPA